jgi:glycerol-3-phosphate acyltransferase PlsY
MIEIFYLMFSYLLGSIPFGFIVGKFYGKNILEIGWRKTSASNVVKNVGFFPGLLVGILDVAKGYLAVWFGKIFSFSTFFQILAGVFAVLGHNWSLYLKFAGGRGIGTFLGAALALDLKIAIFALFFLLFLAIIWNTSVATIFFLFFLIVYPYFFNQGISLSFLSLLSLFPIFLKRLSPIKEIFPLKEKKKLIYYRLLFDNDQYQGFRIKKFFKKYVH